MVLDDVNLELEFDEVLHFLLKFEGTINVRFMHTV
jgi:hypothetical protein